MSSLGAVALLLAASASAAHPQGPSAMETAADSLFKLSTRYGVEIGWKQPYATYGESGEIHSWQPKDADVIRFVPTLTAELARYPAGVFGGKVRRIVLIRDLTVDRNRDGGVAVRQDATLALDVSNEATQEWLRTAFHHEVYHLVDPISDADWSPLNPDHFVYQTPAMTSYPGFVTDYARTKPTEDRAELFAALVSEPKQTAGAATRDRFLRAKIDFLKQHLAPIGFDESFWNTTDHR